MNYITAIGIDQEDGDFVVYTQMMDFTSVAKNESGKTDTPLKYGLPKLEAKRSIWRLTPSMIQRRYARAGAISLVFSSVTPSYNPMS